ncbi:hypothetical protein ACQKGL_15955 [Ensifer adhaerens]|uniref:hypothetical protein n=1 Tax=Ensifer adhaerens TaxID=106592 RepID=UPI003D08FE36
MAGSSRRLRKGSWLPQPAIGRVASLLPIGLAARSFCVSGPLLFQDLPMFADCPNGSKIDGFILNWQAKLFGIGIASCHCSKIGHLRLCGALRKIYRKLLKSQLFENNCCKIEWFSSISRARRVKQANRL